MGMNLNLFFCVESSMANLAEYYSAIGLVRKDQP